jgi:hypothetical protein
VLYFTIAIEIKDIMETIAIEIKDIMETIAIEIKDMETIAIEIKDIMEADNYHTANTKRGSASNKNHQFCVG